MAKGNTLDLEQITATTQRLEEIQQEVADLDEQRQQLLQEAANIMGSGSSGSKSGRGRRGSRSQSKGRGYSTTGESRHEMILRILPTPKQNPIGKQELTDTLVNEGYVFNANDPVAGVSSDLQKLKDDGYVEAAQRGKYRLTADGSKQRDANAKARQQQQQEAASE